MPELAEAPDETEVNPFSHLIPKDIIGGEGDAPAYQVVAGKFSEVPRAEINTPTDYGPFSHLMPKSGQSAGNKDYGPFSHLVPVSPTSEAEKALAETPSQQFRDEAAFKTDPLIAAEKGVSKMTNISIHEAMNTVRVFGAAAGRYIFNGLQGLELNRAKMLAHPTPEMVQPQGDEIILPDGSAMSKEQEAALEQHYVREAQAGVPDALARAEYFKMRSEGYEAFSKVDPELNETVPARLARTAGTAGVMAMEALIPGVGLPMMVAHGAMATEAEARNAGKSPEEAEAAAVRSAIGLAIFGGASKLAALGVAKLLPQGSEKLTKFIAQFTGQAGANETSSRAIAAWEAAAEAPNGQKVEAAMEALKDTTLETTALNTVYALMGASKAAGQRAPVRPASVPEPKPAPEPRMATETARYAKPTAGAEPVNRTAGVVPPASTSETKYDQSPAATPPNIATPLRTKLEPESRTSNIQSSRPEPTTPAAANARATEVNLPELQGAIAEGGKPLSALPVEAVTRPIKSQRQIITDLAKGLNVPIRFGRLRTNKFAGYFMPKADLIGSKRPNDITTVTHEVGHKLDREFSFSADPAIQSELNVLGDPATPGSLSSWTKSKTLKYKHGEGVAEFVRHWLTDPRKASKEAPATHAAFEKILDANKDVGDVLRQARGDIQVWRTSESQARVRSHISVGDNPNKTRYTLSQLTRDLVDDLHILRLAATDAKRQSGGDLPPSKDPYLLARNLRGSYGMADTFVRNGVTDFQTRSVKLGTSLEDALKPVAGRVNDFRDWIVAKRAQELMSQGRETGLLADDVSAVAKRFDTDSGFRTAFQAVKVWNENVLKYAVDSGLVTPEGATAMLKMNQDYVPFHRVFEVGAGESSSQQSMGTGSGLNAGKPGSFKKLHGSRREIVDPIETMVKNAYAIITASEKAAINNAVADLARLPNMGKWVEQVAAPKEQVKVSVEKIKRQLEEAGADVSGLSDDLALTFYRQSGQAPFGENTIRIVKNGKPEFYRLNRGLFDTFHALDLEDSGKLIRIMASPAQLLRSGVVLEPSFAFANAIRDTFSSAVIGKYGAKPFETTARGLGAMINNPKLVAEWAAAGGKSSVEANYFDRSKLQDFVAAKISKDLTPAERAMVVAKSPLTALRYLTGLSEEATRIGEYKIAFDKLRQSGMPEGEARRLAAFEARDRQDFAKGGAKTKIIRHLAAFWNAGLQGNVKLFQTFKERPVRTLMQGFAFVTIPKLLEQAVNWDDQDYWDRPQWERDLFFLIPAGKDENNHTRFIRIPTPFEVGVLFGTLPGRILQWAKQNHDPKALTGYFGTLLRQTVPNPMPQSLQMVFEDFLSGKQGWDVYRGRPIVPESLANQPPELQWTEQTSALAKTVGKTFGYSPMKIDHIIGQTTGGLGKVLTGQQAPGKRFVTTPLAVGNQSTQDFYETLDELRAQKKRSEADPKVKYSGTKLSSFESVARQMSEMRRELRKPTTSEPRKTRLRELIYQKARRALNASPR